MGKMKAPPKQSKAAQAKQEAAYTKKASANKTAVKVKATQKKFKTALAESKYTDKANKNVMKVTGHKAKSQGYKPKKKKPPTSGPKGGKPNLDPRKITYVGPGGRTNKPPKGSRGRKLSDSLNLLRGRRRGTRRRVLRTYNAKTKKRGRKYESMDKYKTRVKRDQVRARVKRGGQGYAGRGRGFVGGGGRRGRGRMLQALGSRRGRRGRGRS